MNFPDAIKNGFRNYSSFTGRASRSQFWYWNLFVLISILILGLVDGTVFGLADPATGEGKRAGPLGSVFWFLVIVPSVSIGARRMHDTGRNGWWQVPGMLSIIGWLLFFAEKGTAGANPYGYPPAE